VGLQDTVVIADKDAVLIADKDHVDDAKEIVKHLKVSGKSEWENHREVHRPWGKYESLIMAPGYQVKVISVNPGAKLSLQKHEHRCEHWIVVAGVARVTKGEDVFSLYTNESVYLPKGTVHSLENDQESVLKIIEIQTGDYLGEDDIIR